MNERSIGRDLHPGLRDSASTSDRKPHHDPHAAPDPALAARFAAAIANDQVPPPDEKPGGDESSDTSPFALFKSNASVSDTDEIAGDSPPPSQDLGPRYLMQTVIELADRVMVGLGEHGRREVRVDLAEDVMPGVSVSVHQQHGEWVADFLCRDLQSHQRLAGPAVQMAIELAEVLRAPARWRVALVDNPQALIESFSLPPAEQSS